MGFGDAISTCYRKYAQFDGRATRPEYWYFFLYNLVGAVALYAVPALLAVFTLLNLIPGIAVAVRRLHDTGHSGAFYFIVLIPLIGAIILIVTLASAGDGMPNQYDSPVSGAHEYYASSAPPPPATTAPTGAGTTTRVPPEGLPARSRPDPTEEWSIRLEGGSLVSVLEQRGAWARVRTRDGDEHWVDGRRLDDPTLPTPQPPGISGTSNAAVLVIVGGVSVAIGSFLPWITLTAPLLGSVSRSGVDDGGDGVITLALGAIVAIMGFLSRQQLRRRNAIWTLILAGLVLVVAFVDYVDITSRIDEAGAFVAGSVSVGIWVVFAGGAVAAFGSIMAVRSPAPTDALARRRNPHEERGVLPPEGLLIRPHPDPALKPLKRLEGNLAVVITNRNGVWARIEAPDGSQGWVDGRRLL